MKPKLHTLILAALSVTTGALPLAAADTAAPRPNVLFLIVDDLRTDLGCYGRSYIKSPNIDRLAQAGMVFNRAYCQQAVCSPSRSSVMTGMRPDTTKVWDLKTHFRVALPDVVTLGQQFKQHGYFVQGLGKIYHPGFNDPPTWSVPWVNPKAPVYALPENLAFSKPPLDDDLYPTAQKGKEEKNRKAADDGTQSSSHVPNSRGPVFERADVPDNFYEDGKIADLAVSALSKISQQPEPFFLAVGFHKPHLPWVAPEKYWALYNPAEIELAPNPFLPKGAPRYAINPNDGEMRAYKGVPPEGPIPPDLARQLKHAYFAGISYSDAQVGRVLAELDRLGLRTNTIIVLWGDHGWKLGEHGSWGKHTDVENDVNAPLILSAPGMKSPGAHTDALVEFVDIYPTLCELAGLPLPGHLEGTSFKPLLDDRERPWKSAAFSQYPRSQRGGLMGYTMRTDRYRFTVWANRQDHTKVDATELYDHQTDPQENVNIVNAPASAALVKRLMEQWKKGWQGAKPPDSDSAQTGR
jgi:iduronate 2-sulfatase